MESLLELLREREGVIERKNLTIWEQAERIGRLERELELLRPLLYRTAVPEAHDAMSSVRQSLADGGPISFPEMPSLEAPPFVPTPVSPSDAADDELHADWPAETELARRTSEAAAGEPSDAEDSHQDSGQGEQASLEARQLADQMLRLRSELQTIAAALDGLSLADAAAADPMRKPSVPLPPPVDEGNDSAGPTAAEDVGAHAEMAVHAEEAVQLIEAPESERRQDFGDTAVTPEEFAGLFPASGRASLTLEPLGSGDETTAEPETESSGEQPESVIAVTGDEVTPVSDVAPSAIDLETNTTSQKHEGLEEPADPGSAAATGDASDAIAMAEAAVQELQRALNAAETRDRSSEPGEIEEGGPVQRAHTGEAQHGAAADQAPEETGPSDSPRRRLWFW
ncbi:MAG TPA: hypothetical protein VGW38_13040 [Chloroflexota bacterium]|nr:hypothetical protein [Chloroflexota bacterium]